MNSRLHSILVFFRRHSWRFVIAGVLAFGVVYTVLHIPDIMVYFGTLGVETVSDETSDLANDSGSSSGSAGGSSASSNSVSESPDFPIVYIVDGFSVYTNLGVFSLGSEIAGFRLVGLDNVGKTVKWGVLNESGDLSSVVSRSYYGFGVSESK